ncbi:hypothetical protein RIR_jg27243.t1 [Rhizophagus irregularis DAOM 181602=DAOM 197198]|nr:hypothetical protein RIR_jg27243.t1 [Rhizophagus irregularis DAOM 181602=DAOM 197198]
MVIQQWVLASVWMLKRIVMDCVEIVNMRIQNEDKLSEWARKLLNSDKILIVADLRVLLFGIEYFKIC